MPDSILLDYAAIGTRIRQAIYAKAIHRGQLCERLVCGRSALTAWEKGHRKITLDTLVAIGKEVGKSLDYLVLGETGEAGTIDYGPMEEQLREILLDVQTRNYKNSRMVTDIAFALANQIDEIARQYQTTGFPDPNGISLSEAIVLEGFSEESCVVSKTMQYNFRHSLNASGAFDRVNAQNLSKGRSYRFLLEGKANEYKESVANHRDYLGGKVKGSAVVLKKYEFAGT